MSNVDYFWLSSRLDLRAAKLYLREIHRRWGFWTPLGGSCLIPAEKRLDRSLTSKFPLFLGFGYPGTRRIFL